MLALGAVLLAGCSGGGGRTGGVSGSGGDFLLIGSNPLPRSQIFLNDSVFLDFTRDVDLGSANLNSVAFSVFDLNGQPLQEQPRGTFRVLSVTEDGTDARRLQFEPTFPRDDAFSDGGFRAARRYVLQLAGGDPRNQAVLRSKDGKALREPATLEFQTVIGDTPELLFRDTKPGGPAVLAVTVEPSANGVAYLNKLGQPALEIRMVFDQALNPSSNNVPTKIALDPTGRNPANRGRIYLEYDDGELGRNTWIPAEIDLERNELGGATVLVRPVGVLPNNAKVRVIVEPSLEDMAGQSNRGNSGFNRVVSVFDTQTAKEPQFDALVENFDDADNLNLDAPFSEPFAEVGDGYVRAGFEFEGNATNFDYRPSLRDVVLNTDFTTVTPANGEPYTVSGGVFEFRNVTIPPNVTVRGAGSRPMVWLVTGDFKVFGELTVRGGDGARVDTLNSANFPTPGGIGVCGGGNGGKGSPSTTDVDLFGEPGFGPGQRPGLGGSGGPNGCTVNAACNRGGGGAGGSYSTQGDPHFWMLFPAISPPPAAFDQRTGLGGKACVTRSPVNQARPGPLLFSDLRQNNNFWGVGVDRFRQLRIRGELLGPQGGSGGGGGGDTSPICPTNANFANDNKGGGGGAGGGVLIIKVLGAFEVYDSGRIIADGGGGGGGEQAGTCNAAGGGGGGSGGMIVIQAARGIHLVKHGRPYLEGRLAAANGTYDMSISADGGVGLRGPWQGNGVEGKYPPLGLSAGGSSWDANPCGGFGGLGIIQLMVPPGDNSDRTNTVLDDNIHFYNNNADLIARQNAAIETEKRNFLGWRGWPNEAGQEPKDDSGNNVVLPEANHGEGDMRPSPFLLPLPFAPLTRLQSVWIDTGASVRLPDPSGTSPQPRTITERVVGGDPNDPFKSLKSGPTYLFAGTFSGGGRPAGYAAFQSGETSIVPALPEVLPAPIQVASLGAGASSDGTAAYRAELTQASPQLGEIPGRYVGYIAQLRNDAGSVAGEFRILGHDDRVLLLSPDGGLLPTDRSLRLQVIAKFFGLGTQDGEGFGPSYVENGRRIPQANVRIGFAFHVDPKNERSTGDDPNRFPRAANTFFYGLDLSVPSVLRDIRALGKSLAPLGGARYVKYDIQFNTAYSEVGSQNLNPSAALRPGMPLPELRYLVLPMQF
jgi:hypothetical protein